MRGDDMTKKNFLSTAGAIKGMSDAPNLRACAARQCGSCNFFQTVEGDWEIGQCAKHEFQSKNYLVCDDWQERPMEPLAVVVIEEQAPASEGEMMNAARALAIPNYVKSLHLPHDEQFMRDVLAAKFIGKHDIKSYGVLWGNENLVDLETEFFTNAKSPLGATDFWKAHIGTPRPLTWNHAQDKEIFKAHPVVGDIQEFGEDEIGLFYNAVLERSNQYRRAIDQHISQRNLGTSSDSAPQYVERVKTKKGATWLKTWPLFAAALTDVPCEPRMIEQGNVYWKNVGVNFVFPGPSAEASQAAARAEMEKRVTNAQRQHQLLNLYTEV